MACMRTSGVVTNVPPALRGLRQWVLWRYEHRGGKRTKCPYQVNGHRARANDPRTWTSLEEALAALTSGAVVGYVGARSKSRPQEPPGPADGLGIMFGKTVFGIDVDHARDPETSELSPECRDILDTLQTYSEVSPSGAGVHALLLADTLPGPERRRGNVEIYGPGSARFFTFTGDRLPDSPPDLAHRQAELEDVHQRYVATPAPPQGSPDSGQAAVAVREDDAEVLRRASGGRYGEAFSALWRGDLSTVEGDHSRGDHALCRELLFWSGGDLAQADRLFRQSGLYREKWDERRGEQTYGAMTLGHARATLPRVWAPDRTPRPTARGTGDPGEGAEVDALGDPDTDLALARRFVAEHVGQMRHVPEVGWLLWDGRRWAHDTFLGLDHLLQETAEGLSCDAAEAPKHRALRCAARRACSRWGQDAMRQLARHQPEVLTRPDELDADPWLLCCENGTLDLRDGTLRPHRREDGITALVPTAYQPEAQCPRFEAFLAETVPDPETRAFLQRLLGYGLTGETSERVLALCVGPTASGKSTLAAVLRGVLGGDILRGLSADALVRTNLEDLRAACEFEHGRLLIGSEVPREGAWRTSLLKSVTGGADLVSCRPLYCQTRQFRPRALVLLFANHYPKADATDGAFWERCRIITFGETCPPERRDPNLVSALLKEREGILAWMVRGCRAWQEDGLRPPRAVVEAGARYRLAEDVVGRFLEERTVLDPTAETGAGALFAAFGEWCAAEGEPPCTRARFSMTLSERGLEQRRRRNTRLWRGLRLRTDSERSEPQGGSGPGCSTPSAQWAVREEPAGTNPRGRRDAGDAYPAVSQNSLYARARTKAHAYSAYAYRGFCQTASNASPASHVSPSPEGYAAESAPHTVNGRSVQGAEQEQDIVRGLRAADTFAALLEQAGIDHARVPRRVSEPDGGADFILPSGVGIDVKTTTLPDRVVVCSAQIGHLPEWLACFHTTADSERFLGVIRSEEFLSHSALVGREGEMPGPARADGDPYRAHDDLRVLWGPGLDRLLPITALREDT